MCRNTRPGAHPGRGSARPNCPGPVIREAEVVRPRAQPIVISLVGAEFGEVSVEEGLGHNTARADKAVVVPTKVGFSIIQRASVDSDIIDKHAGIGHCHVGPVAESDRNGLAGIGCEVSGQVGPTAGG